MGAWSMKAGVRRLFFCSLLIACLPLQAASTAPLAGFHTVSLHNGFNRIRLADRPATVAYAWRENYNAHGFSLASIYLDDADATGKTSLLLVPAFGDNHDPNKEQFEFARSGGADCLLRDFRLLTAGDKALLVIAMREPGTSYTDAEAVHFDVYSLRRNDEGIPGRPHFYFSLDRRIEASRPYCDVGEALKEELKL